MSLCLRVWTSISRFVYAFYLCNCPSQFHFRCLIFKIFVGVTRFEFDLGFYLRNIYVRSVGSDCCGFLCNWVRLDGFVFVFVFFRVLGVNFIDRLIWFCFYCVWFFCSYFFLFLNLGFTIIWFFSGLPFWLRVLWNVGLCLVADKIEEMGKKMKFFFIKKLSCFEAVLGFGKKKELTESEPNGSLMS